RMLRRLQIDQVIRPSPLRRGHATHLHRAIALHPRPNHFRNLRRRPFHPQPFHAPAHAPTLHRLRLVILSAPIPRDLSVLYPRCTHISIRATSPSTFPLQPHQRRAKSVIPDRSSPLFLALAS